MNLLLSQNRKSKIWYLILCCLIMGGNIVATLFKKDLGILFVGFYILDLLFILLLVIQLGFEKSKLISTGVLTIGIVFFLFAVFPRYQEFQINQNTNMSTFKKLSIMKFSELKIFCAYFKTKTHKVESFQNKYIKITNQKLIDLFLSALGTATQVPGPSGALENYYMFTFLGENNKYSFLFRNSRRDGDCRYGFQDGKVFKFNNKYFECNDLELIDDPTVDAYDYSIFPNSAGYADYSCDELIPLIEEYVFKEIHKYPDKKYYEIN